MAPAAGGRVPEPPGLGRLAPPEPLSCRYSRLVLVASIVVLNWKDEAATKRCIASVRQLKGVEDCELIVVDNESTEASRLALSGLGDVRLVPLESNTGFGAGMNVGIDVARGENIALFEQRPRGRPHVAQGGP